jgi:hypothetical protein
MGIPRGTARLLLEEARRQPFHGAVLQLGRSSVYFTLTELLGWARRHGVELRPVERIELSHDPRLARQGCLSDETFFHLLGFERVESCDVSDWEDADHLLDLNRPVPDELKARYDAVLDPGSILQIFHQPQLFKNLHDFLKPGGRVIHAAVPSNNHVDLGFYMFSPTFFHDYYAANAYRIEYEYLCEYFPYWHLGRLYSAPWKVWRYEPGCLDALSYGRFGARQTAIFMVATKTQESTGSIVPQLGQFVRSWKEFEERRDDPDAVAGELRDARATWKARLAERAERWLLAHPAAARAWRPVKRVRERLRRLLPSKMPPLVGRY